MAVSVAIFAPHDGVHVGSATVSGNRQRAASNGVGSCVKAPAAEDAGSLSGKSDSVPMNFGMYPANSGCVAADS